MGLFGPPNITKLLERRDVKGLLKALDNDDHNVRRAAASALGDLRERQAVGPLIARLADSDAEVRGATIRALRAIGDVEAAEPLLALLAERPSSGPILEALAAVDPNWPRRDSARTLVPTLSRVLFDPLSRDYAAWALGEIGDPHGVEPLIRALSSGEASAHQKFLTGAVDALTKIDPGWRSTAAADAAVSSIAAAIATGTEPSRFTAALKAFGGARAVAPLVAALLNVRHPRAKEDVVEALNAVDPQWAKSEGARAGVPAAIAATATGDAWNRTPAIRLLQDIGDRSAIPALCVALTDPSSTIRDAAGEALKVVEPRWAQSEMARAAVEPLMTILTTGSGDRIAAAHVLGEIGDRRAVTALLGLLTHPETDVRETAVEALNRIDPDWPATDVARALGASLVQKLTSWADEETISALGELREPTAIEPMNRLVEQGRFANVAARALTKIEPNWPRSETAARALVPVVIDASRTSYASNQAKTRLDAAAVGPLVLALADSDRWVREAAENALTNIDPAWLASDAARAAVPGLIAKLTDFSREARNAAVKVLDRLDPDWRASRPANAAVPDIARRIRQSDPDGIAAWAAGEIGDLRFAQPLVAALVAAYSDLREAAAQSLRRLDPVWMKSEDARALVTALVRPLIDHPSSGRYFETNVMRVAAEALGELGDAAAVAPLVQVIQDPLCDADVKEAAALALRKLESCSTLTRAKTLDTRATIGATAKKIIMEHLGAREESVIPTARFVDDLRTNSLDIVELVMAFEEEFQITIPEDVVEQTLTVGDAVNYVCKERGVA